MRFERCEKTFLFQIFIQNWRERGTAPSCGVRMTYVRYVRAMCSKCKPVGSTVRTVGRASRGASNKKQERVHYRERICCLQCQLNKKFSQRNSAPAYLSWQNHLYFDQRLIAVFRTQFTMMLFSRRQPIARVCINNFLHSYKVRHFTSTLLDQSWIAISQELHRAFSHHCRRPQ